MITLNALNLLIFIPCDLLVFIKHWDPNLPLHVSAYQSPVLRSDNQVLLPGVFEVYYYTMCGSLMKATEQILGFI